jgi:hypothetical protein
MDILVELASGSMVARTQSEAKEAMASHGGEKVDEMHLFQSAKIVRCFVIRR